MPTPAPSQEFHEVIRVEDAGKKRWNEKRKKGETEEGQSKGEPRRLGVVFGASEQSKYTKEGV